MTDTLAAVQYGFAPALASALFNSLWQDALLALAASLVLRAMARASAAGRHNVAMAFLVAMALVPALQFLRLWQVPGAGIGEALLPAMTAPRLGSAANVLVRDSSPVAPVVALLWLAGVGLMLMRHAGGLRAIASLERRPYQPLPPYWRQRADEMRKALGIARAVAVRLSDEMVAPCAARLLRPVIWLPLSLLTRSPVDQIEALLAHELAHVARRDWLWNGVQCVIESLFFFHPAIWWLGRRIRQEREHACDDLAVAACGNPIALAEALTALERARHEAPRLVLAAHGGSLMQRISRLLSVPQARGRRRTLAVAGALAITGAVMIAQLGIAGGLPDLVVEASTSGPLGRGDYRQITANGLDKQRFYREDIDARGARTEIYREDGEVRPIDAGVRRWIAEIDRMSTTPPQASAPSAREMTPAFDALVAQIAANPDVVARLGRPAVPTSRAIDGNLHVDTEAGDGAVAMRIELSGPKGRATVAVAAVMSDHVWILQTVAVQ